MIVSKPRAEQVIDGLVLGGLLLTVAILPLQEFGLQFAAGMCLILLFLWGVGVVVREHLMVVWTRFHSLLLIFLSVVVLQLIPWPVDRKTWPVDHTFDGLPVALDHWRAFSIDPLTTAHTMFGFASLIGFFFLTANLVNSEKRLRWFVNGLVVVGVVLISIGILDKFSPSEEPLLRRANAVGVFYYSLGRLSGFIELILPLPLALIITRAVKRAEWIWWNACAAIVMGIGIASADTTGGLLVLVIELMVLLVLGVEWRARTRASGAGRFRKGWVSVGASVTVGAIIAGTAWLGTGPSLESVKMDFTTDLGALQGLSSEAPEDRPEDTRIDIWKNSLRLIADHPILGTGFGTFPIAYTRYDPGTGSDFINAAHNDYLQLVCETGVLGGLTMGLFLLCLVQLSTRSLLIGDGLTQAVALGASVGCLGILVHSLVDFHLQNPGTAMLFLTLVALLVCVVRLKTVSPSAFRLGS